MGVTAAGNWSPTPETLYNGFSVKLLSWQLRFFYVLVKSWTFTWRWENFKAEFDIITSMQSCLCIWLIVLSQPPPPLLFLLRRLEAESASTEHCAYNICTRVYGAPRLVNFFLFWIRVCTIHSFTPTQVWLANICMCDSLLGAGGRLWSCSTHTFIHFFWITNYPVIEVAPWTNHQFITGPTHWEYSTEVPTKGAHTCS